MADPDFQSNLQPNLDYSSCFTYEDNMLSSASSHSLHAPTNLIKSMDFQMSQIITFPYGCLNRQCAPPPLLGIPHPPLKTDCSTNKIYISRSHYGQPHYFTIVPDQKKQTSIKMTGARCKHEQDMDESSYQIQAREVRMPFIKNENEQAVPIQSQELNGSQTMPSRGKVKESEEASRQPSSGKAMRPRYPAKKQKTRPVQQKVVRCFPSKVFSESQQGEDDNLDSQLHSYSNELSDQEFLLTVPQPKTHRKLRNRKYKKSHAQKSHYYAKDELTKKIMRDIREQLYKSFISTIPAAKLNNRAYQITTLKTWLQETQGIKKFEVFDEQDLVTVFCHLRVRKIRAKALKTGLTDLQQILAGSKFKTIQFLRTETGRYLFYERFKKLWRHKVQSENILKREDLRTEFTIYFRSIENEVEAKFVHSKPTRGKPPLWKE